MFGFFAARAGKEKKAIKETSKGFMFGQLMFWASYRNPPDGFSIY
jgi:hypothetical protein